MGLFPLPTQHYILTVSCPDRTGIVAAISGFLAQKEANILDSSQYSDPESDRFFIRVHFETPGDGADRTALMTGFAETAERFGMDWDIHDATNKPRVLVMVSREGHCLNDLLYRYRIGTLPVEIPCIVSNHRDFYQLSAWHDIPFHHVPINKDSKQAAEDKLIELIETEHIDLVVLARYMQILSPRLCEKLAGRCINIHHSFLPSFKGARPYHQAWQRGVKLIGATAHYVTPDLDEGPIIEQEVERVDHRLTPDQLAAVGQDIESRVLARAVRWHAEHRVFNNGSKTVVFR